MLFDTKVLAKQICKYVKKEMKKTCKCQRKPQVIPVTVIHPVLLVLHLAPIWIPTYNINNTRKAEGPPDKIPREENRIENQNIQYPTPKKGYSYGITSPGCT